MTPDERISDAVSKLTFDTIKNSNTAEDSILSDLTLPTTGANGTAIAWGTSNALYITASGVVNRPEFGNEVVTFSGSVTYTGGTGVTKSFTLTVKGLLSPDYYVATTGNDGNIGSKASPFKTLQKAIDTAFATGSVKNVFVASGTYTIPSTVTLTDSVNLYGGFNTAFTDRNVTMTERDQTSSSYNTIINSNFQEAVFNLGPILNPTVIDGFVINRDDQGQYALHHNNNASTGFKVRNLTIKAAGAVTYVSWYINLKNATNYEISGCKVDCSGLTSSVADTVAIRVESSSGLCYDNYILGPNYSSSVSDFTGIQIYGAKADSHSYILLNTIRFEKSITSTGGVFGIKTGTLNGSNQIVEIYKNTINMDLAALNVQTSTLWNTYISGIYCDANTSANTILSQNTIRVGGTATGSGHVFGIAGKTASAPFTAYNNTIEVNPASCTSATGIRIYDNAGIIKNNMIVVKGTATTKYGILISGTPAVTTNYIYVDETDSGYKTGNFTADGDPFLDGADDLKLTINTPDNGKTGGENLTSLNLQSLLLDKADMTRSDTGSWSIGAYCSP